MRVKFKSRWMERAAWLAAVAAVEAVVGPATAVATISTPVSFGNVTLASGASSFRDVQLTATVTRIDVSFNFNPSNSASRPSDLLLTVDSPDQSPAAWGGKDAAPAGVTLRGDSGLSTTKTSGQDSTTISVVPALTGAGTWRLTVANWWSSPNKTVTYSNLVVTLVSGARQSVALTPARAGDYNPVFTPFEAGTSGLQLTGLDAADANRPALALLAFSAGDSSGLGLANFPGATSVTPLASFAQVASAASWATLDTVMRNTPYTSFVLVSFNPSAGIDYNLPSSFTMARIAAIPEPTALGLVGAAAVGLRRRRR